MNTTMTAIATTMKNARTRLMSANKKNDPQALHSLVGIQPRHLRLMQFHLNNYFRLLCEHAQEGDSVTTIAELRYLDGLISGIMGDND
jgi:hypothetical protein